MTDGSKRIFLGYPLSWGTFQYGGENGASWKIQSSDAASPILITTVKNNTLATNDNVFIYQHEGNLGVDDGSGNDGNFLYTNVSANSGTLQSSTGVTAGVGGWIAKCASGAGVTGVTCRLKTSHTKNATTILDLVIGAGTSVWVDQAKFRFQFNATATQLNAVLLSNNIPLYTQIAREIFWTDASGNLTPVWEDDIQIISL